MSRPALLAALFAGAAAISGFTILQGGAPFDEGIVLQAARRVADGQVVYRDFDWAYGPAQPYLLGSWFDAFEPSLLVWRVVRVLCDAAIAVVVYSLVRREGSHRLALAAWLAAACAMAQPYSATPTAPALLCSLLALALITRGVPFKRAVPAAALLVALAAAWRLDFGVYAGAAVSVAVALQPGPPAARVRAVGVFTALAGAFTLLAYLPLLIAVGPLDAYAAILGDSLGERDYWTLPFPLSYDGPVSLWPPGELASGAKDLLDFYVPLLLVLGLAVAVLAAILDHRRTGGGRSLAAWASLVLAGGCLTYLLSRMDEFHSAPLLVALTVALPVLAVRLRRHDQSPALVIAALAVLALLVANGVANRGSALLSPPRLATIDLPAADGTKAPPAEARALQLMARAVGRVAAPDEPIYTITRRSDLVRVNQPLVYVFADRDNPTGIDYGLQTGAAEQRRLVGRLRTARPAAIVRWLNPASVLREPNLRGEPSGSRLLDEWVAGAYRPEARYGDYEVLVPRLGG